jgi:hypothetical protein
MKKGVSQPKPPVGLEFELTPPFLEANPDVKEAMPAPETLQPLHPPAKEVPWETGEVKCEPVTKEQIQQVSVAVQEAQTREVAEAFLWGAASGVVVCATFGFLLWMLWRSPSLPPPGPA